MEVGANMVRHGLLDKIRDMMTLANEHTAALEGVARADRADAPSPDEA